MFDEGAISPRLIEQACSCSTLRDGGEVKVRARLCLCQTPRPSTLAGVCLCSVAAVKLRQIEQACGRLLLGARRMRTQSPCSSLPLALEWRVLAAATRHVHWFAIVRWNRYKARTDRARLRLLHGAKRGGGGLEVRARLCCLWHLSGECLPPRPATCRRLPLFGGAATKLGLIEQGCGCSTVRSEAEVDSKSVLVTASSGT